MKLELLHQSADIRSHTLFVSICPPDIDVSFSIAFAASHILCPNFHIRATLITIHVAHLLPQHFPHTVKRCLFCIFLPLKLFAMCFICS